MATTTRTKVWVSGDVLTASDLNTEFNNLLNALALGDGDVSSLSASEISGTALTLSGAQTVTGNKTFNSGTVRATRPQITTSLDDSSGNEIIETPATGSAVNQILVRNSATGNDPRVEAAGDDTNIHLDLRGKANGLVKMAVYQTKDGTNLYKTGAIIIRGSAKSASTGGSPGATLVETETHGLTFADATEVFVIVCPGPNGSSSAEHNSDQMTDTKSIRAVDNITTTAFDITYSRGDGTNLSASIFYYTPFIIIGTL